MKGQFIFAAIIGLGLSQGATTGSPRNWLLLEASPREAPVESLDQTPTNDDFANRIAIAGATDTVIGSNVGATAEAGDPAFVSSGGSVWWTWTAPFTGLAIMDTIGSSFDTLLGVYEGGALGGLSVVAEDDDSGGGGASEVIFGATAGRVYQIAVDGFDGASGEITLHVAPALLLPPPNDNFAGRIPISGATNTVAGSNVNATMEANEPAYVNHGRSVWWTWTAPSAGDATIDTIGSTFDTVLGVYTGANLGSLATVAEDDDGGDDGTSLVTFSAASGTSYQLAVDGYFGEAGAVTLHVSLAPPSPPAITTQPQSQTREAGLNAVFSLSASGAPPLFYQWRFNGTAIPGATNPSYTRGMVQALDAGNYSAVVSNLAGRVTSSNALLTVTPASSTPRLWAIGSDAYGQLGDGAGTNQAAPVAVASGAAKVAAGGFHSLLIKSDGTLWAMGWNAYGQLGDGTTTGKAQPTPVASNVMAVAAGAVHSLFIKSNGTLWAMGFNGYGRLGDGTTTGRTLPVPVASNVTTVAAGGHHSLFLQSDGTLWAMGFNLYGQLGDGTFLNRALPTRVASNVTAVAAGGHHSLFLKNDGTLWTMGLNRYGQLGDGTIATRSSPAPVASNVTAAVGGYGNHSLFVKSGGALWAMGDNRYGQLGDGTHAQRNLPVPVAGNVIAAAGGNGHSLFLQDDGTLWTMGANNAGQLGDGSTTARAVPVPVAGGVSAVAAGDAHSVFIGGNSISLPPSVMAQPQSQTVVAGANVVLSVTALNAASYQWFRNGTILPDAWDRTLALSNVTRAAAGVYAVALSNAAGGLLSSNAILTVLAPTRLLPPQPLPAGGVQLRFGDASGVALTQGDVALFKVYANTNLAATNWLRLTNTLRLTDGMIEVFDGDTPVYPQRFYRVIER